MRRSAELGYFTNIAIRKINFVNYVLQIKSRCTTKSCDVNFTLTKSR